MLPDIEILNKILKLRDHIDTIGQNLGDNIFQTLGDYLDPDSELEQAARKHIKAAMDAARLSDAELEALWDKLKADVEGEIPEKLRPLLKAFSEFGAAKPGKVEWPFDFDRDFPANSAINAGFKVAFTQSALLRAYPSPPDAVSALVSDDQAVLCVSNATSIKADARAGGGLDNGSFGFTAGGEASLDLENYYRHEPSALFGVAVLQSLVRQPATAMTPLPLPFMEGMLANHFIPHPSIVLSSFKRYGKLDSSAELGFAAPSPLAGGLISSLSLDLTASLLLEGGFQTRVSRLDAQTFNITVEQSSKTEAEASLTASVDLDIKQQMGRVHSILSAGLDEGKALVDRLQFDWSLSKDFTERLSAELKKLGSGNDWNEFVESLFSEDVATQFIKDAKAELNSDMDVLANDVNTALADYIGDYIEDGFAAIPVQARNRLENLLNDTDVIETARAKVLEQVTGRTEAFIAALAKDTKGTVNELIGQPNLAVIRPLVKRLEHVDKRIEKIRDRVTGYLQRYLKQLEKLASISELLAENEIKLALSIMRSKKTANSKLIDIDFSKAACLSHSAAIDALLRGQPDLVFALARANTPGIIVNECLLQRTSKTARQSGFSVAVLDFKMDSKCLLTEEVEFRENPVTGLITVGTRSSIAKTRNIFGDSRSIDLVNVFQLSNAKQTGTGSIGVTFNRSEDTLNENELNRFLASFVGAGLLTEEQKVSATEKARAEGGTLIEHAEIVAGLRWDKKQLANLLANPADTGQICDFIAESIEKLDIYSDERINTLRIRIRNSMRAGERAGAPDFETAGQAFKYFTSPAGLPLFEILQGRDINLGQVSESLITAFARWRRLSRDLSKALHLMAEVYHSGSSFTLEEYEELSEDINDCFRDWIKTAGLGELLLGKLFSGSGHDDEIKSSMLILLKLLNRLSSGEDALASALSIAMTVGEGNKKKITTLV